MRRILLAAPLALLLFGCASQPLYQRVTFSEPNPFAKPGCKLAVEAVRSDQLAIEGKSEAEWLAGRTPEQQSSFQQDKRTSEGKFTAYLQKKRGSILVPAGTSGADVFVLRPTWTGWDPGVYGFSGGRPAAANITFEVADASGRVLDQFTFHGTAVAFSAGERMWAAFTAAGWAVEQYLGDRWSCDAR
jgi:hypothetical protein